MGATLLAKLEAICRDAKAVAVYVFGSRAEEIAAILGEGAR